MKSLKTKNLKRKARNEDEISPSSNASPSKKPKSSCLPKSPTSTKVRQSKSLRKLNSVEKRPSLNSKTRSEKTIQSLDKRKSLNEKEKENDSLEKNYNTSGKQSKKGLDHVLKNVKVNANIPEPDDFKSDSEESSDDYDIDYIFNELKKYGVKVDYMRTHKSKTTPTDETQKKDKTQSKTTPTNETQKKDKTQSSSVESSKEKRTLPEEPQTPVRRSRFRKRSHSTSKEESSKPKKLNLTPVKESEIQAKPLENCDASPTPGQSNVKIKGCDREVPDNDQQSTESTADATPRKAPKAQPGHESPGNDYPQADALMTTPKTSRRSSVRFGTPRRSSRMESERFTATPTKGSKFRKSMQCENEGESPKRRAPSTRKRSVDDDVMKTPTSRMVPVQPTTPLEKARTSLHVGFVPECLPCREREFRNIFSFVENKLVDGIGGCMYISGVPGTGKTVTVTQVVKKLREMADDGKVPDFKFIEINGMRLADPRQAYILLWQGLSGKKERVTVEHAYKKLDGWFSKGSGRDIKMPTLLLVDELDLICTRKQEVVYNLLDWPTKSPSRLIVLAIANTMDMPERLFKGRVTSRMGLTRLTFLPYTYKQLEEIITTRLTGLNAFSVDAIRLVTRKVAAVSGDARRSLDICRRATELPAPNETVKISHIEQAIREMTNSNSVKVIRSCSAVEKLFLRSVSEVSTRTGVEEVDMRDVIDHFNALSTLEGFSRLPVSDILLIAHRLKCFRLIFVNNMQRSPGIMQKLTLNVSQDDIHYGLKGEA